MNQVSDEELLVVIKDFLEMGHVDNIAAMFDKNPHISAGLAPFLTMNGLTFDLGS